MNDRTTRSTSAVILRRKSATVEMNRTTPVGTWASYAGLTNAVAERLTNIEASSGRSKVLRGRRDLSSGNRRIIAVGSCGFAFMSALRAGTLVEVKCRLAIDSIAAGYRAGARPAREGVSRHAVRFLRPMRPLRHRQTTRARPRSSPPARAGFRTRSSASLRAPESRRLANSDVLSRSPG